MLKQINKITIKHWFLNCEKLLELYKNDCSLPMIIEWALYKNYSQLKFLVLEYEEELKQLENKYGTLQPDGSKKVDTSSNTVMEMYLNELNILNSKNVGIEIETVHHKLLKGFKGVSLEVISLLNFMIS